MDKPYPVGTLLYLKEIDCVGLVTGTKMKDTILYYKIRWFDSSDTECLLSYEHTSYYKRSYNMLIKVKD